MKYLTAQLKHAVRLIQPKTILGIAAFIVLPWTNMVSANSSPDAPNRLSVVVEDNGTIRLSWDAAKDSDGAVVGYLLTKNEQVISLGNVTHYTDWETASSATYRYSIAAVDNSGAISAGGPRANVTVGANRSSVSVSATSSSSTGPINHGACIDTDGDGYGWNGKSTCVVFSFPDATGFLDNCIDADGDGWGWNGAASCKLANTAESVNYGDTECIDSDGDGFGWNGYASCKP